LVNEKREFLEEMVIEVPRKTLNRKLGKVDAQQFLITDLEFINFIEPKKKEIDQRIYKISYHLKKERDFKSPNPYLDFQFTM